MLTAQTAIDRAALARELAQRQRMADRLRILAEAAHEFSRVTTMDLDALVDAVARRLSESVGDYCLILLATPDNRALELAALHAQHLEDEARLRAIFVEPMRLAEHPIPRQVHESGAPFLAAKVVLAELHGNTSAIHFGFAAAVGMHSLLIVPLCMHGRTFGQIVLIRARPTSPPFDDDDLNLARGLADRASLAIASARALDAERTAQARISIDEQRFRLAAIVESSDDAMISKTLDGIVTSWNAAATRLFGYTAAEMIGQPIAVLAPVGHEGEESAILARVARGERVASFDTVRVRKDGTEVTVSVTISPVRDSTGALIGASKVVRDITARRLAEQELEQAKASAEAVGRELETFSYSVAHDLRAPLRAMNGFAQLLVEGYASQLDAEGQDWLQEILTNARKMGALIDALLALARLTRSELRYEAVDVSALVRAIGAELAAAEPARVVELVVEDGVVEELDPTLARAVIENLLANAWKFTSKVAHARVELGTVERGGVRTLFVRDNGAGFDMAYADKLFGPFQRLHTVREFPGTGIGLATAQRIVHRHGGAIYAEGIVDGGATFYFSFPDHAHGARR